MLHCVCNLFIVILFANYQIDTCKLVQESALVARGHRGVEASRAVFALLLAARALCVEMVVAGNARHDLAALGNAKALAI